MDASWGNSVLWNYFIGWVGCGEFWKYFQLRWHSWKDKDLSDILIAYDKHLNGSQYINSNYPIIEPLHCKENLFSVCTCEVSDTWQTLPILSKVRHILNMLILVMIYLPVALVTEIFIEDITVKLLQTLDTNIGKWMTPDIHIIHSTVLTNLFATHFVK